MRKMNLSRCCKEGESEKDVKACQTVARLLCRSTIENGILLFAMEPAMGFRALARGSASSKRG